RILDHFRGAAADALADAAPLGKHGAALLQRELDAPARRTALHRLRPRLQDEKLAGLAVLRPFDVHRAPIVVLDDQALPRERDRFGVRQRELRALARVDVDDLDALLPILGVDHARRLAAEVLADDRKLPG